MGTRVAARKESTQLLWAESGVQQGQRTQANTYFTQVSAQQDNGSIHARHTSDAVRSSNTVSQQTYFSGPRPQQSTVPPAEL